jgi:cellulose synthase/poly-beta-1,6-N-acetylglucosamine synthase-like glycosyltransferase
MSAVFLSFAIFYALNALYYFVGLLRLNRQKQPTITGSDLPFVSVIIPARNEAPHMANLLTGLLRQTYPEHHYEIIIVDDFSTDNTAAIVQSYTANANNLRLVPAPGQASVGGHKKKAILRGIAVARGAIIVSSDADCTHSESWIESFVQCFQKDTGMIAGIPVFKTRGKLIHYYQALDYGSLAFIAVALIANKTPIMCSAANLAYRRETFAAVGGYGGVQHFISGDDDLLLQKIAIDGQWQIKATAQSQNFVYTEPVDTVRQLLNQRARWGSKGAFYPLKWVRVYLFLVFTTLLSFLVAPIFVPLNIFLTILAMKFATDLIMAIFITTMLKNIRLWIGFIPVFILQPLVSVIAAIRGFFGQFKWK